MSTECIHGMTTNTCDYCKPKAARRLQYQGDDLVAITNPYDPMSRVELGRDARDLLVHAAWCSSIDRKAEPGHTMWPRIAITAEQAIDLPRCRVCLDGGNRG